MRTGARRERLGAERRLLLAGALDAGNVAQAVREARPYGVDCARGVECVARASRITTRAALRRRGEGGEHEHHRRGLAVHHPPDARGRFGRFGGRFVPETVMAALDELEAARRDALTDPPSRPSWRRWPATTSAARRRSTSPSG